MRSYRHATNPPAGLPQWLNGLAAALGLVAASPALAAAAVAVKLSSQGPVLFSQERVGRGGELFRLLKLRTMRASQPGPRITGSHDARITAVGRVLRRIKLDEIPQLINVLRGEMALVGPRPEVPEYVALGDEAWQEILSVRPGLTDPVTVRLRNEERLLAEVPDPDTFYREHLSRYKRDGYQEYVRARSVAGDLFVLAQTLGSIVFPASTPPPSIDAVRAGWTTGKRPAGDA